MGETLIQGVPYFLLLFSGAENKCFNFQLVSGQIIIIWYLHIFPISYRNLKFWLKCVSWYLSTN